MDVWSDRDIFEESYVRRKSVSAAATGDTALRFFTAMLNGYPLEESLQLVAVIDVSCLTTYGAYSRLRFMRNWRKIFIAAGRSRWEIGQEIESLQRIR